MNAINVGDRRWWRRQAAPAWLALLAASALLWVGLVVAGRQMGNGPGTMGLSAVASLGMGTAMMAAMMWPPLTPVALSSVEGANGLSQPTRVAGVAAFATGFLVLWAAYRVAVFVVVGATGHLATSSPDAAKWLGLVIFVTAGLYQFSGWKARASTTAASGPVAELALTTATAPWPGLSAAESAASGAAGRSWPSSSLSAS